MMEFKGGDRVRVRSRPTTVTYAGMVGEVIEVDRAFAGGPSVSYVVCLDPDTATPAVLTHAVFGAHDLEPAPGKEQPLTDFKVGDRVRVLSTHSLGTLAGRRGTVTTISRNLRGGPALYYQVCLDDDPTQSETPTLAVFQPKDLEPAPSGPP